MKIAFMFPGQGAQTVGMGKDLYDKYEEIREVYTKASEISGNDGKGKYAAGTTEKVVKEHADELV